MATKTKKPEKVVEPAPEPKSAKAPEPDAEHQRFLNRREQEKAWTAPQPHSLDELLAKGDLVARYLANHGNWVEEVHLTHLGRRTVRVLRYCECPICTDAVKALGLTD